MGLTPIPADYKPEDSFTSYKDGTYTVDKIEWFTIDKKSNRPILVNQVGQMVGRCRMLVEGEESGPPLSIELGDMSLLLKAFNVKAELPPLPKLSQPDKVSEYMETIEKLINAAKKTTKVVVSSAWVQSVEGMDVPEMYGYFDVLDVSPKNLDGQPESITKNPQYGYFFFVKFRVLSGEGGNPSPYDGATFTQLVNYSVEVKEVDGVKTPSWEQGQSGQFTANAQRQSRLMSYTAPEMFEGEPLFSNPYNLLPDWLNYIKEHGCKPIKGSRVRNKKGNRIDLDLLNIQPAGDSVKFAASETVNGKEPIEFVKDLLTLLTGSPAFVQGTLRLTAQGRNTAKAYLTPLKDAGTLKNANFDTLNNDDITAIFEGVLAREDLDTDLRPMVEEMKAEFDGEEVAPF